MKNKLRSLGLLVVLCASFVCSGYKFNEASDIYVKVNNSADTEVTDIQGDDGSTGNMGESVNITDIRSQAVEETNQNKEKARVSSDNIKFKMIMSFVVVLVVIAAAFVIIKMFDPKKRNY